MDGAQEGSAGAQKLTFTPVPIVSGQDAEPPKVVRSGNGVFIIWHEFPPGGLQPDIFLSRSADRGETFGTPMNLSKSPAADSRHEDIAVSRSGDVTRVYVVWTEAGAGVLFRRDMTNNGTFSNSVILSDAVGGNNPTSPRIVASGDNVFVVWQAEHPQAGDNTDIFFARSTSSGDSFVDKQNVSNNGGTSEAPQIALIGDDRVIVTWRDNSEGNFDIFFARSQ